MRKTLLQIVFVMTVVALMLVKNKHCNVSHVIDKTFHKWHFKGLEVIVFQPSPFKPGSKRDNSTWPILAQSIKCGPVVQIRANSPDLCFAILAVDYDGQSTKTDVKQGLTLNQDQL